MGSFFSATPGHVTDVQDLHREVREMHVAIITMQQTLRAMQISSMTNPHPFLSTEEWMKRTMPDMYAECYPQRDYTHTTDGEKKQQ